MSDWREHFRESMSLDEIKTALCGLPYDLATTLREDIKPLVKGNKIQGIKKLREISGFSLKLAKYICDALGMDVEILVGRCKDPDVIDAVEEMERLCKLTVRKIAHDSRSVNTLLTVKDQLASLWSDLVLGDGPRETDPSDE